MAKVFTILPDGDVDPESPITTALMTALRDNTEVNRAYVGTIRIHSIDAEPLGWLRCSGQAVSRTTFDDLFAAIGTVYGVGDGSTTFNVPDLRGRTPIARDNLGGTSANRITDAAADSMGGNAGFESNTLSAAHHAPHAHTERYHFSSGGSGTGIASNTTDRIDSAAANTGTNNQTDNQGSGSPFSIKQPWIALNFIIKH